jgi:hypothetical protein
MKMEARDVEIHAGKTNYQLYTGTAWHAKPIAEGLLNSAIASCGEKWHSHSLPRALAKGSG